jgi:nicotinate phosphoribosyltransferase
MLYDPFEEEKSTEVSSFTKERLMHKAMGRGSSAMEPVSAGEISKYLRKRLDRLPAEHKRFMDPHTYMVGISRNLLELRQNLARKVKR